MNVKLTAITAALIAAEDGTTLTPEQYIVYCARVSNPTNQLNTATADKLLAYCICNHHWSIFEQVDMTVEIKTSRAIAAQILRHRSFSFQEFSQRYAEVTDMEPVQIRKQGLTNRQSSEEAFDPTISIDTGNDIRPDRASWAIDDHLAYCQNLYSSLLNAGVAKEVARMVLPMTTQTTLYMKGSVRSWIHYLQIRCDQHTQLEHRQIALAIRDIFDEQFPAIAKALSQPIGLTPPQSVDQVAEFHRVFNHSIASSPVIPSTETVSFRTNFIREELDELEVGVWAGDLTLLADALGDIQYVLDGFFLNAGLHEKKSAILSEIHRSNMSKACKDREQADKTVEAMADQGVDCFIEPVGDFFIVKRKFDGKVMKALGYSQPNLGPIVNG